MKGIFYFFSILFLLRFASFFTSIFTKWRLLVVSVALEGVP